MRRLMEKPALRGERDRGLQPVRGRLWRRAERRAGRERPAAFVEDDAEPQQHLSARAGIRESAADRPIGVLRQHPRFQDVTHKFFDGIAGPRGRFLSRTDQGQPFRLLRVGFPVGHFREAETEAGGDAAREIAARRHL